MTARAFQPTLDEGTSLIDTVFVVVDLETTGSGPESAITEIGAVKVRGGEVIGEFQTLVDPLVHIPALIQSLTGITDNLVAGAPDIGAVLPSFMEFIRGAVLVAHNASFDIGFLKRACAAHDTPWGGNVVIDTVTLSRSVLLRDEVPNHKLATLAHHFGSPTAPDHRALTDARATVDVLHGLIGRISNLGVHTVEDLQEFARRVPAQRRAKRTWADGLPDTCGVYYFFDHPEPSDTATRRVLYVGKSVNLRRRVRTYFTAAETRRRMDEMVRVAAGVDVVRCATELQAEIVELRLIAQHSPRYNRRSKFPHKVQWLKLTDETYPRLSAVRQVSADQATYFGPFRSRENLDHARAALHDTFDIRQCTDRLSTRRPQPACALAELGRCLSPCDHSVSAQEYAAVVARLRTALAGDVRPVLVAARDRLRLLIDQERFEDAAALRTRLETWVRVSLRHHRVAALARCPQIVAAAQTERGWDVHVIRYGRLAGAGSARHGEAPQAVARDVVMTADTVPEPLAPQPAGTVEEAERLSLWLERPGVRLIHIDGDWWWPRHAGVAEGDLAKILLGPPPARGAAEDTISP